MKTKQVIESNTDNLLFGYWDEENQEFIALECVDSEKIKKAAELFECSPLLVDTLIYLTESIAELVGKDLKDIWNKI